MTGSEPILLSFTRALTELGFRYDLHPDAQGIDLGFQLTQDLHAHMRLTLREQDCVQDLYTSLIFPPERAMDGLALLNMIHRTVAHVNLYLMADGRLAARSCLYTDPLPDQERLRGFLVEPISLLFRISSACAMVIEGRTAGEAVQTISAVERRGRLN